MSDDLFTGDELRSPAYSICMGAFVLAGAVSGGIVGGAGAALTMGSSLVAPVFGAAFGAAAGKYLCPALSGKLVEKLQSPQARFTPFEVQSMVATMRRLDPRLSRQDALNQLAAVRIRARRASAA